jgi:uncharacterized protein
MNLTETIKQEMILRKDQTNHDVAHFLKVASWARLLAISEGLSSSMVEQIEITAYLHDIACPLCREKYGSAPGPLQEKEGMILADKLLSKYDIDRERIVYIVGHHHTLDQIDGIDYQIMIEADYLVNADEANYSYSAIQSFYSKYFKTKLGKEILYKMYLEKKMD